MVVQMLGQYAENHTIFPIHQKRRDDEVVVVKGK
jgi:hypothetical protein